MDWITFAAIVGGIVIAETGYRALFYPKLLKKARETLVQQLGEMVEANDEVTVTIVRSPKKG